MIKILSWSSTLTLVQVLLALETQHEIQLMLV